MTDRHHPLAECERCPLYDGPGYVPTSHGPGAVAVVGQAPSWNELRAGAPFVGPSGELLAAMIVKAGAGKLLHTATVSNAVSCVAPDDKVPAKAVACCAPRLQADLESSEQILALGKVAAQAVTGWSPKITDSPLVTKDRWEGRRVVVAPHPAAVLRAPAWGPKLQAGIERLSTADVSVTWEWSPYEVARDGSEAMDLLIRTDARRSSTSPAIIDLEWPEDAATKWDRFDVERLRCMGLGLDDRILVLGERALLDPQVGNELSLILTDYGVEGHNAKGDVGVLARKGIHSRLVGDTMMAEAVLDEVPGGRGLEAIASRRLGLPDWKPADSSWYTTSSDEELWAYQAQDIAATREAKAYYQRAGAWEHTLHRDLLVPACAMLQRVEDRGMGIDDARMAVVLDAYEAAHELAYDAAVDAFDVLDHPVNPRSWMQLLEAYAAVGVHLPNTDAKKTLRPLIANPDTHPAVVDATEKLLAFKHLATQLQTYLRPLSRLATRDHRVHAEFGPASTETGRLNSARPNMQNWPRPHVGEGGLGDARSIFWAGPGRVYVKVDLSQAELRVIGVESEPYGGHMLAVCNSGRDLHTETSELVGCLRVIAKNLNFGLGFGLTPYGVQQQIGCSEVEAHAVYNRYYDVFTDVKAWQDVIKATGRDGGHLTTVFGRTRRPLDFGLLDDYQASKHERELLAFTSQAVVSDITLSAAIDADAQGVELVNLVHDEIRAECDEGDADEVAAVLSEAVRVAGLRYTDRVEFPVEVKVSTHWT